MRPHGPAAGAASRAVPPEQPVGGPRRDGAAAGGAGAILPRRLPGAIYAGPSIADRAVLAAILHDVGSAPPDALAAAEAAETKRALRQATEQAQALGVFGAPSFITASGELFWGNDRLEEAIAWAKREGPAGESR
jgi:2-hydroxychromene-2-carboxylate isomerase